MSTFFSLFAFVGGIAIALMMYISWAAIDRANDQTVFSNLQNKQRTIMMRWATKYKKNAALYYTIAMSLLAVLIAMASVIGGLAVLAGVLFTHGMRSRFVQRLEWV